MSDSCISPHTTPTARDHGGKERRRKEDGKKRESEGGRKSVRKRKGRRWGEW